MHQSPPTSSRTRLPVRLASATPSWMSWSAFRAGSYLRTGTYSAFGVTARLCLACLLFLCVVLCLPCFCDVAEKKRTRKMKTFFASLYRFFILFFLAKIYFFLQ